MSSCITSGAMRGEVEEKLTRASFALEHCWFVNKTGLFGWYVSGKILRRRVLPRGQLHAFSLLLPLLNRGLSS